MLPSSLIRYDVAWSYVTWRSWKLNDLGEFCLSLLEILLLFYFSIEGATNTTFYQTSPYLNQVLWPLKSKQRRGVLRRAVFSDQQRKGLENAFLKQKYINKPDRKKLASKLSLKDSQVKIWFQNRRMKWRNSKERELMKRQSVAKKNDKTDENLENTSVNNVDESFNSLKSEEYDSKLEYLSNSLNSSKYRLNSPPAYQAQQVSSVPLAINLEIHKPSYTANNSPNASSYVSPSNSISSSSSSSVFSTSLSHSNSSARETHPQISQ